MKSIKKTFLLILATVMLTSCTVNEVSSISSSVSTYSSEISEPIISEEINNYSEEFKELYKQYENQYNEKLGALHPLFTTRDSVRTSDVPVAVEEKNFFYEGLPAAIEKMFNANDGTIYQYVITITGEKSITKYIYYFDDNDFTYCQKIEFFYFTKEKEVEDLMRSKSYLFVQKQNTDETFLMIDHRIEICVPIEKKEIFTLDEMNNFFEISIGNLPNDEIILKNSVEEILGGLTYLDIEDFSKNQEIYKEYMAQINTMFETLTEEYTSSYKKQKKFSLESDQNRDFVYSVDGFFEGTYLTRISTNIGDVRHYISQVSGYGGERAVLAYSVPSNILYQEWLDVGYADREWMYSNQKLPIFYSADIDISDSKNNIFYRVIPELKIVYSNNSYGDVYTFAKIDEDYDSYTNIIK